MSFRRYGASNDGEGRDAGKGRPGLSGAVTDHFSQPSSFRLFAQDSCSSVTRTPFAAVLPTEFPLYLRLSEASGDLRPTTKDYTSRTGAGTDSTTDSGEGRTTDVSNATDSLSLGPSGSWTEEPLSSQPRVLVEHLPEHSLV